MTQVNVHEAKTHLSRLLERAEAGQEIVIARHGRPVARLTAFSRPSGVRRIGSMKGKIWVADDFDAPMPPRVLRRFLSGR